MIARVTAAVLMSFVLASSSLAQKPGRNPTTKPDPKDRTPPRKDDPEQVENVPGREEKRGRKPDPDEVYRTGRQGRV